MNVRRTLKIVETINTDAHGATCDRITRVAALAIVRNPFAGKLVEDLSEQFEMGGQLGEQLMDDAVRMLANAPVSYGKAAIVGIAGDMEQGGAMIHPKLGKPMRAAVGAPLDATRARRLARCAPGSVAEATSAVPVCRNSELGRKKNTATSLLCPKT